MTAKSVYWSSVLLVMAGLLIAIPVLFRPDVSVSGYAIQSSWITVNLLFGIACLASIAGLAALYSAMSLNISAFGRVAFGLAILGNVLVAGLTIFVNAVILPVVAGDPEYQMLAVMGGPLMSGIPGMATLICLAIACAGYLFLAGYLVSAKTISIGNGILFLGAPLAMLAFTASYYGVFAPSLVYALGMIGGVVLGAGIFWLGISLRTGMAHDALEASLKAQDECFAHAGGHA